MNLLIFKKVLGCDVSIEEVLVIFNEYVNISFVGFVIVFYKYCQDMVVGVIGVICFFGVGYLAGSVIVKRF